MSLQSVRSFLAEMAPDLAIIETEASSATVALAAAAHGVQPDRIAKTLCLRIGDDIALVVTSGEARLDNSKFKRRFGAKPRMLTPDEVQLATSHPVGGVCPFGLPSALPVYCDEGLQRHQEVIPAAGAGNAAIRISPARLAELTGAVWIDVCHTPDAHRLALT